MVVYDLEHIQFVLQFASLPFVINCQIGGSFSSRKLLEYQWEVLYGRQRSYFTIDSGKFLTVIANNSNKRKLMTMCMVSATPRLTEGY